jgi:hypothetical protein
MDAVGSRYSALVLCQPVLVLLRVTFALVCCFSNLRNFQSDRWDVCYCADPRNNPILCRMVLCKKERERNTVLLFVGIVYCQLDTPPEITYCVC